MRQREGQRRFEASGFGPRRYGRPQYGSQDYSRGYGTSSYGSRGYGTGSYGTGTYGTSGYSSMGANRYDTSNYGTTGYGMSTGVYGTAGYGSTSSQSFAVGGYAPSDRSRGEVFQSSRYGPRCERYNIPWQESVARVWGFQPQAGDIGTQDYCQPGEGKTGPVWQGRRRSMQRLPQSRTHLAYGGSGLQGSELTPYGKEMIRPGAVPLYEWGMYSSSMRQIEIERARARRGSPGPSWDTNRQPWPLLGTATQSSTRAPSYRAPTTGRQMSMGTGAYPTSDDVSGSSGKRALRGRLIRGLPQ